MNSCLYEGRVMHRRLAPREHGFQYRLFMLYLDLDELPGLFDGYWLWSARRPAPAWFRRADHLGDPALPLQESVRRLVAQRTGTRPAGPVRLLTHLRYLGHGMNPVSFYYCFDSADRRLDFVVAEINNTPWGEQHCYVLDCRGRDGPLHFEFAKDFHVSPFMPMSQSYCWDVGRPGARLSVAMRNVEAGRDVLRARLALARRPLDALQLARVLGRFPLMTVQVIGAIYWQALRLWLKGIPFFSHPRSLTEGRTT